LKNLNGIIIPIEKFTEYALNPNKQPNKALAFDLALGYNLGNAEKLIENIRANLGKFPYKQKGNNGYGNLYEVAMDLTGENGKTARVLTGWIENETTGVIRLTSVYVDRKRKESAK